MADNNNHTSQFDDLIFQSATKYGLDPDRFRRQIFQESGFRPDAISKAKCVGLGQINPKTAKSYGVDPNTLTDPSVNLDLSARIMKDNLAMTKGDYNGALAMYNGGTKARIAYMEGRYEDLPKETYNYIRKLGDDNKFAKKVTPQKTPEQIAEPEASEPAEASNLAEASKLADEQGVQSSLLTNDQYRGLVREQLITNTSRSTLLGQGFRSKRWASLSDVYDPATDQTEAPDVGFFSGLTHNWLINSINMSRASQDYFGEQFKPSDEERAEILQMVGYDLDRYQAVLNGAGSIDDVKRRIKVNEEYLEYKMAEAKAGLFSSVMSSIGSAVTDPLSYVPVVGAYGMAGRIATGAVLGAVSNQLETYTSGAEHDIIEDMIVGGIFGAGIEFAFKGMGKAGTYVGDSARRANIIRDYQIGGKELPSEVFNGIGGSTKVAKTLNNLRENFENKLPVVTVMGVVKRLQNSESADLFRKIFIDRGSGTKDAEGHYVATTYDGITAQEKLQEVEIKIKNFEPQAREHVGNLRKEGYSDVEVMDSFYRSVGGAKTKLDGNAEFEAFKKECLDMIAPYTTEGGVQDFFPRVADPIKVSDRIEAIQGTKGQRGDVVNTLTDQIAESLIKGYETNPAVKARIDQYYYDKVYKPKLEANKKEIEEHQKKAVPETVNEVKTIRKEVSRKSSDRFNRIRNIEDNAKNRVSEIQAKIDGLPDELKKAHSEIDKKVNAKLDEINEAYKKNVAKAKTYEDLEKAEAKKDKAIAELTEKEKLRKQEASDKIAKKKESYKKQIEETKARAKESTDKLKKEVSDIQKKGAKEEATVISNYKYDKAPVPLPEKPSQAEINQWVRENARSDAYGWVDQNQSNPSTLNLYGTGNAKYDPNVTRIPWDTSQRGASGIGIDDFRADPIETIKTYINKKTGDSIVQGLGFNSEKAFREHLTKLAITEMNTSVGKGLTKEQIQRAFDLTADMIYGKYGSRADINGSWLGAMADVTRNLTFLSKNALMGVANIFEQGEAVKHYGAVQILRNTPLARELFDNWTKNGMSNADVRHAQSFIFGLSVKNVGVFRDIAQESYERQLHRFQGNKYKAMLVSASESLAQASPFTKFIQSTENSIVEGSQGMFLGELIQYAHNKSLRPKGFLTKETLYRNGVSVENFDKMLNLLRESTTVGKKGEISITNLQHLMTGDVMGLATLRRLGDYVAHEVIQKNTIGDTFLWEGSKRNPFMQLLFQFKTFAIRSYDKRIRKMMNRAAEGDALGQAYSLFLSTALGTVGAMANTCIGMAGMTEEQREEYLKQTIDYDKNEGVTMDTLFQVGINGVMRSSVLAFPALVASTMGYNPSVKTTADIDYFANKAETYKGFDADKYLRAMFPAYSTVASLANMGGYGKDVVMSSISDDYTEKQAEQARTRFTKSVRSFSNIPFLKWGLYNLMNEDK